MPLTTRFGLLVALLLPASTASAQPPPAGSPVADEQARWAREGTSFALGGGADVIGFLYVPTAGLAYVEGSLNVGLSGAVDFRLTGMLGLGGGVADSAYVMLLSGLRASFRFSPVQRYAIWLGYEARVGVAGYVEERREPAGVLPLHGPSLSLASFRFGSRGQFEIDHHGGMFVAPIWGYFAGLAARYAFAD